jgi:hypothetical protein
MPKGRGEGRWSMEMSDVSNAERPLAMLASQSAGLRDALAKLNRGTATPPSRRTGRCVRRDGLSGALFGDSRLGHWGPKICRCEASGASSEVKAGAGHDR